MKSTAFALMVVLLPAPLLAQGIEFGVGVGAPVTNRNIVTQAHVDLLGYVRSDKTLDASPQAIVELHKTFKVGKKLAFGPMVAFAPKLDLGVWNNNTAEQPLGAGFGMVFQVPSKLKQHINVGVVWLVTEPTTQLADDWHDGYPAPRYQYNYGTVYPPGILPNVPAPPEYKKASINRVILTMTVSGFLR